MKIIILNLPRNLSEEELTKLFATHGTVESTTLVLDKQKNTSKGFGFVEMPDQAQALNAIKQLHGRKVGENKIRVKEAG